MTGGSGGRDERLDDVTVEELTDTSVVDWDERLDDVMVEELADASVVDRDTSSPAHN